MELMDSITEIVIFHLEFDSVYWDRPPWIKIFIDDEIKFDDAITTSNSIVKFSHKLRCGQDYQLKIERSGKTDDQCVVDGLLRKQDQYIIIQKVVIDMIDIKNLIDDRCWYEPDYSRSWATEQLENDQILESKIIGETWLSHNGTWRFYFSSPIYQFVIKQFR